MRHSTGSSSGSFPLVEPPPPPRPIRPFGRAVLVALGVTAFVQVVDALIALTRIALVDKVAAGPDAVDPSALQGGLHAAVDTAGALALLVTGAVFVVWSFRARANAESITYIAHRRARPWLIFAWLVPPVNLWYPKQIVDDLWRTSQPQGLEIMDLYRARRPVLVGVWWVCWLAVLCGEAAVRLAALTTDPTLLRIAARLEVYLVVPVLAAAALLARVVVKISGFQEARCASGSAPGSGAAPEPAPAASAPAPSPAAAPDRSTEHSAVPKRPLPKRAARGRRSAAPAEPAAHRPEEERAAVQEQPTGPMLSIATFPPPVPLSEPPASVPSLSPAPPER